MHTRDDFVRQRATAWQELDRLLSGGAQLHTRSAEEIARGAALYRAVCSDLMHVRAMGFGHDLADHLNALAARGHNALYGPPAFSARNVLHFLFAGFPQALRANWRYFLVSSALFWLPFAFGLFATLTDERFALQVVSSEMLEQLAGAYAEGFAEGREVGQDSMMAGFYVYNNVGIAFRCFATGILFGIGSVFFLVYNGLNTGAVLGYVTVYGAGKNIFTFICGHGPFELTAIVISGAAGLKMGYALVRTDGSTRLGSLRRVAPELVQLVSGAAVMLLLAAAIEGFWSPSSLPDEVKWAFSGLVSVSLTAYFVVAGRSPAPRAMPSRHGSGSVRPPAPPHGAKR